jgi:anti-sigma regulatory factor (Ser/Thr protein kinase)
MEDCLDLESNFEMVAAARAFVRSRLSAWEMRGCIDDAVLVVSELVTNAVLHARSAVRLRLVNDGPAVRVEVYDENTRLPVPGASGPDATSGRGIAVVSAVAESWGMELEGDGKVVWAEFGAGKEDTPSWQDDWLDLGDVDSGRRRASA